jgi:hypothetical protein
MPLFNLHPCQHFNLEELPNWSELRFNNEGTQSNEEAANGIELAFQGALRERGLGKFLTVYFERAREILDRSGWDSFVYEILGEALSRMVGYYVFLVRRSRSHLAMEGSSVVWRIEPSLMERARALADDVVANGQSVSPYYKLSEDRRLYRWVHENVRPVIESYVGSRAIAPHAHIRAVSAAAFGDTWEHLYAGNPYGYFHWDESCYSIPLIVYLDDVQVDDGPYSYVEGSDKLQRNFTIRAFTQAISCKLLVTNDFGDAYRKKIAALPRIFRGGEMVGAHLPASLFQEQAIRRMVGAAGTAVLSDGFSLVHAGGHPTNGRRRALFIAHRFPRKKLADTFSSISRSLWRLRVRRRHEPARQV